MRLIKKHFSFFLVLLSGLVSQAVLAADVSVEAPYARAVPPNASNSAAFMTLHNHSAESISLVSAESDVAEVAELHNHIDDDGVMRMRQVEQIEIPAEGSVALQPGSFHVMLLGLKHPLQPGDPVAIELHFSDGSSQAVQMEAQRLMMHGDMHHGMHH